MAKLTLDQEQQQQAFEQLEQFILQAKKQVWHKINMEQTYLYWSVGAFVSAKLQKSNWGQSVVDGFAGFLKQRNPGIKGFDRRAIYRMVNFYDTYSAPEFVAAVQPLIPQQSNMQIVGAVQPQLFTVDKSKLQIIQFLSGLSWSAHLEILSGCSTNSERVFYLLLSQKENLTYRELGRQIESGVYERTMRGNEKLSAKIRETHPNIFNVLKDKYMVDYLQLPEQHSESDIHKGLLSKMKDFILDLGRDFLFVDEQFRVQVGMSDFFIDLLFYHRVLRCFVAIELKAKKFVPEYLGKLEFYLEALDRDVKHPDENPSIGILLCKSTDDEVVEYALNRSASPTMIAKYQQQLIPKEILQSYLKEIE